MKKLLLTIGLFLLPLSTLALSPQLEEQATQVSDVLEQQIENGRSRDTIMSALDAIISAYPQFSDFFSAVKSKMIVPTGMENAGPIIEIVDTIPVDGSDAGGVCSGHIWIQGSRGGCYYINSSGNKTYGERYCCH